MLALCPVTCLSAVSAGVICTWVLFGYLLQKHDSFFHLTLHLNEGRVFHALLCNRGKVRPLRQNKTLKMEECCHAVVFSLFLFCFCLHSVCYDRAPWYPTALTFVLSALWHGIYPGYYFTFLTGILITLAARAVCTFHCSLLRPILDAIQLSTAGATLQLSSSLCLL